MTDKELLELAAKAAGFTLVLNRVDAPQLWRDDEYVCFWNPLTDDGDALRLAVKLKLDVSFGRRYYYTEGPMTFCGEFWDCRESVYFNHFEKHNGDPYAATRRAVVRAAAEIGKAMK